MGTDEGSGGQTVVPAELEQVALRLARADEAIYGIADLSSLWSFNGPYDVEQRRTGNQVRTVVTGIRPIPPLLWLLYSEALNHLRAAVDNTVWALVEREHGPVNEKVASLVSMPITPDENSFSRWLRKRTDRKLQGFAPGDIAHDRLRSLQPFVDRGSKISSTHPILAAMMGATVEDAHPLILLQGYSNADKHRAIRPAFSRSLATRFDQPFFGQDRSWKEFKVGDVLASGKWGEPMGMETSTAVMVERPEPYQSMVPPAKELSLIHEYVRGTAIPTLWSGLVLPRMLPPHAELGDNGETERERLANGRWESATERMGPVGSMRYAEAMQREPKIPPVVDETPTDADTTA